MRRYLLLLLPLLGMGRCDREIAPQFTLQPATQTGANTLSFKIDGRVWQNYGWLPYTSSASDNLRANYYPRYPRFNLLAGQVARDVSETFAINFDSLTSIGTYKTARRSPPGTTPGKVYTMHFSNELTNQYYLSDLPGGSATFTITKLDTVAHIVCGTFSGLLTQQKDSTKGLNITDGRFDVTYE